MPSSVRKAAPDHDLDAGCARIHAKLLRRIEEMLDELAPPRDRLAARRVDIFDAAWTQCAPLVCRQALCRRAKTCRNNPCRVKRIPAKPETISHGTRGRSPGVSSPEDID